MKEQVNSQMNFSGISTGNLRSASVSRKTSSKSKKKLKYNYREVSGQILRAKKLQSASAALSRAKSKMVNLQKCKASGEYDTREVDVAIAHAKRMIRCARMKVNHMKEEAGKEKVGNNHKKEQSQHIRKISSVKNTNEKNAVKKNDIKEAEQKVRKIKQEISEQKRRIKNHRMEERSKVLEADMKYLKEGGGSVSTMQYDTTAIMELSAMAAYLMAQEHNSATEELEEYDVALDTAVDGSSMVSDVLGTVTVEASSPQIAAEAVTVDVTI